MISRDKTVRAIAIDSMDTVYSTAKATLVVDRLLLSFIPRAEDDKQTALAIIASDWMTRLLTMQEVMLSQNLLILTNRDSPTINPRPQTIAPRNRNFQLRTYHHETNRHGPRLVSIIRTQVARYKNDAYTRADSTVEAFGSRGCYIDQSQQPDWAAVTMVMGAVSQPEKHLWLWSACH